MQGPLKGSCNWNEYNLNPLTRNNWRASLVPAAAVIPAPIAYINVVAVKKLVVGFWTCSVGRTARCVVWDSFSWPFSSEGGQRGGFSTDWACLFVSHLGAIWLSSFSSSGGGLGGWRQINPGWGVFSFL